MEHYQTIRYRLHPNTADKDNRKVQADFVCQVCDHQDNADRNAAFNVLAFGSGAAVRGYGAEIRRPVKHEIDAGSSSSSIWFPKLTQ